jgi:hypothetical protein
VSPNLLSPDEVQRRETIGDNNNSGEINARTARLKWTNEVVLRSILKQHEIGQSLRVRQVCNGQRTLYLAARRRFGSWRAAIAAAGLDPNEILRPQRAE